ncbi:E2F-associated phosphoprotein [Gastrophryne carolinensis]
MNHAEDDAYVLDELSDEEQGKSSSEDELDLLLHGTPDQKRKFIRECLTGESESSSDDEFEKEMENELSSTMKVLEGSWNLPGTDASTSSSTASADTKQQYYEDIYFDSDSDEEDMVDHAWETSLGNFISDQLNPDSNPSLTLSSSAPRSRLLDGIISEEENGLSFTEEELASVAEASTLGRFHFALGDLHMIHLSMGIEGKSVAPKSKHDGLNIALHKSVKEAILNRIFGSSSVNAMAKSVVRKDCIGEDQIHPPSSHLAKKRLVLHPQKSVRGKLLVTASAFPGPSLLPRPKKSEAVGLDPELKILKAKGLFHKVIETSITTQDKKQAQKRRHKVQTNDDLLYDPLEDDRNQKWIDAKRRYRFVQNDMQTRAKHTEQPMSTSDAILNCPACMTMLCLDCQRHETYKTQYRAMFVLNCSIDRTEALKFSHEAKKRYGQKKIRTPVPDSASETELYHPVKCNECSTQVAVFDKDEVYHFFNVLASHC